MARVNRREFQRMFSASLPTPLDVPNLIYPAANDAYRTYSRLVAPMLALAGAKVRWAGRHVAALSGSPRAAKLLMVSYPNHRRFMGMIANPVYLFANRWRERGVDTFEASFTTPVREPKRLGKQAALLVVHYNSDDGPHDATSRPTLDGLQAILEPAGASLVYASVETTPMTFLSELAPHDPNPLEYKETALFEIDPGVYAIQRLDAGVRERVQGVAPGAVLQVYERLSAADLIL